MFMMTAEDDGDKEEEYEDDINATRKEGDRNGEHDNNDVDD